MKYTRLNVLLLMIICHASCGQNQTNVPQGNITSKGPYSESQLKEAETSKVPMSMVRNIKKARNGDILIASYLGVFRYDGKSFTNLTSKIISPRFSSFWDVLEDRKGNLWFASRDSGVYCYPSASVSESERSIRHFTTRDGLANNRVMKIYEDKAGNIWFGTGAGVSLYDGKSFRNFIMKEGFGNNDITTIMEDKTGKLWFGTRGNISIYDGKKFTILTNKNGKTFKNVWGITQDKQGNIWFGENGLWRYDGKTFTKVSQMGAYAIIEDKKENIWTAGNSALSRYDANSLYNKVPTVTEIKLGGVMDFLGILEDNDGDIWFGSGGGVTRYNGKSFTDFKNKEGQK